MACGLALSACGSSRHAATTTAAAAPSLAVPTGSVVVQVGNTPITTAQYQHWMLIGDATVERPTRSGPLPKLVSYEPPAFTACVAHLRANVAKLKTPTTQKTLETECRQIYTGIQSRILNTLISGYWLRGEAVAQGLSVSAAEITKQFEQEKLTSYPTAAAFRRLQQTSHQTVPDLMFAVETKMLSEKLFSKFQDTKAKGKTEGEAIAAFNQYIDSKWTAKTSCRPGYVVKDCAQAR
jgi:hypothetical protein